MALESVNRLMLGAEKGGYAVGYFESWNFESLLGVIDAAEQTSSPVIIGFSGDFLSQRVGGTEEDLAAYGAMGRAIAMQAKIPCGFIFNECARDSWVARAITAGFNLVMPADPEAPYDEYRTRVKHLADLAHERGVAVEGDLEDDDEAADAYADRAAGFVDATGVDLLAVSVGNEEIRLQGRAPLDLSRLDAVHRRVQIPLVLHGGTGIEEDSLKSAIRLGVRKVNYGTYIKQRYIPTIRRALDSNEKNPHALVGDGGEADIMVIGRKAVRDAVLERIDFLGCCGQA
jgi:fructose/tagatose bisphosphate aldolase